MFFYRLLFFIYVNELVDDLLQIKYIFYTKKSILVIFTT